MSATSMARFLAYFFTSPRRFSSRLIRESFAMSSSALEREVKRGQQRARFRVGLRGRCNRNVQSPDHVDLVVLDLGEDVLFLYALVDMAAGVERPCGQSAEGVYAVQGNRHEATEEFLYPLLKQGQHA